MREERKKREGELAVIRSLVIIGARVLLLLAYSTSRKGSASKVHCELGRWAVSRPGGMVMLSIVTHTGLLRAHRGERAPLLVLPVGTGMGTWLGGAAERERGVRSPLYVHTRRPALHGT